MVVISRPSDTAAASPDSCTTANIMEKDTKQQEQQLGSQQEQQQHQILTPTDHNKKASPSPLSSPKSKKQSTGETDTSVSTNDCNNSATKYSINSSSKDKDEKDEDTANNNKASTGKNASKKRPAAVAAPDVTEPSLHEGQADGEKPCGSATATKTTTTSSSSSSPSTTLLSTRPVKRGKTAYFIFCDEKRPEVQKQHLGEGVTVVAKALGRIWAALTDEEKQVYQQQAAEERERVAHDLEAWKAAGGDAVLEAEAERNNTNNNNNNNNSTALALPAARIRKICKLDPEVKGLSKEALLLITKTAELFTAKLGVETVRVAQIQNRRKLLPEDVAQVCQSREPFYFLREDIQDLAREQKQQSAAAAAGAKSADANSKHNATNNKAAIGTKPMTAYFATKTKK